MTEIDLSNKSRRNRRVERLSLSKFDSDRFNQSARYETRERDTVQKGIGPLNDHYK